MEYQLVSKRVIMRKDEKRKRTRKHEQENKVNES